VIYANLDQVIGTGVGFNNVVAYLVVNNLVEKGGVIRMIGMGSGCQLLSIPV
jgi:hypothetical protein